MTDHADLIAEARGRAAQHRSLGLQPNVSLANLLDGLADALEAQSAPLVAESKAKLVAHMQAESFAYHARFNDGPMPHDAMVDALVDSGALSVAGDRDRALKADAWDDCAFQWAMYKSGPTPVNPYRESEGER